MGGWDCFTRDDITWDGIIHAKGFDAKNITTDNIHSDNELNISATNNITLSTSGLVLNSSSDTQFNLSLAQFNNTEVQVGDNFNGTNIALKMGSANAPEIDFNYQSDRRMVFGYDNDVSRGIFYSDNLGGGVFVYDADGIGIGAIGSDTFSDKLLKVVSNSGAWDEVQVNGLLSANDMLADSLQCGAGHFIAADSSVGISQTITTAKLTAGGSNGSMTFKDGILTAQTAAT